MTRIHLDPADFRVVIDQAVDAAVAKLGSARPRDSAGRVLITKRQAAELLGVSEGTVDRWRSEAGLPFVKIDGKVLFRPSTLETWAADRETT